MAVLVVWISSSRFQPTGALRVCDTETLKFLTTTVVLVVGWFVVHQFNVYRDHQNKRRDLRIQFLLDAYRRLESAAHRGEMTETQKQECESAVADIQCWEAKSKSSP